MNFFFQNKPNGYVVESISDIFGLIDGARGAPSTYGQLAVVGVVVVVVRHAISQRILNRFAIFLRIYTDLCTENTIIMVRNSDDSSPSIFFRFSVFFNFFPNLHTLWNGFRIQ